MDKAQKQKAQKALRRQNVLEALKDVGGNVKSSVQEDLLRKMPGDVFEQLFGPQSSKSYSGEIVAGEAIEINEVFSGKAEENEHLRKQISFERTLRVEEQQVKDQKIGQLRMQLHAIMQEVVTLSQVTGELAEETQIAAMQAPVEPGIYHLIFFETLLDFLQSFRKKVEDASVWLHSVNKRAQKKNFWGRFKSQGSKFLLSGESYSQRSAG
jgi:hypothetical protein